MIYKNKSFKYIIILFILSFLYVQTAECEGYITIYNIKFLKPDISSKHLPLWKTLKASLVKNINKINYYNSIEDEDISDIKIKFRVFNIRSTHNFNIEYSLLSKKTVFSIRSKKDFEKFPGIFTGDLKAAFPLRGVIFKIDGLYFKANIGRYYDVKKGDIFIIVDKNDAARIKGLAIVLNSLNRYSEFIITAQNQKVNNNDILLPFTYDLHLQYHPFEKISYYGNIKTPYEFSGLYGPAYKIFSSLGNYIFISDEKETGFFIIQKNHYEKIEDVNYNQIHDVKFDLKEKYLAYLKGNHELKLVKPGSMAKHALKFDKKSFNYNLILEKEGSIFTAENVYIDYFSFYKEDNIIFIDNWRQTIVDMNIKNNSFKEISIANKLILPPDPNRAVEETYYVEYQKVLITPNNKKVVLLAENKAAIIKDLETGMEELIEDVDYMKMSKSGVYLVYKQGRKVIFHDLYTEKHITFSMDEPFDDYMLSYSERYLVYIKNHNPNSLNYIDREEGTTQKDVFKNMENKYIIKLEGLYDDNILVYGKLFDLDDNKKLDYRDLNNIIYFNFSTGSGSIVEDNVDDFYQLGNYKKYIIFNRYKKLLVTRIKNEKISK